MPKEQAKLSSSRYDSRVKPRVPLLIAVLAFAFSAHAAQPRALPRITRVHISKKAHRLELLDVDRVVKSYGIALGPGGAGPKTREGDKITPTGHYVLSAARSSAKFHRFVAVSYPNDAD